MAKAIYRGVSGVARKVKQPSRGVNGVSRKVKNVWRGVSGVARHCYASFTKGMRVSGWGNRTITYTNTASAIGGKVSGGTTNDWSGVTIGYYNSSGKVLIPKGTVVQYTYTGTSNNSISGNCDFGCKAYNASGTEFFSSAYDTNMTNATYTFAQDGYFEFFANVGNTTNANAYASISLTKFVVGGVTIFPGEVQVG